MIDPGNKQYGAVFTPAQTADLAASLAEGNVLDPCCGNGNLLVAVVHRRLNAGVDPALIASQIFGIEIQEQYALECRERLILLLGEDNRDTITRNIVHGDFLAKAGPERSLEWGRLPGL